MNITKTLAAALVLTLGGMNAAQACNAWLTIDNQRSSEITVDRITTHASNGSAPNASKKPSVGPHSQVTTKLVTLRYPNKKFSVSIELENDGSKLYQSNVATCREGFTIVVP